MADSTHTNPVGFLPYGATDDSIILQHPLTSDPTSYFESIATTTVQGTGHAYDSTLGFAPNGTGGFRLVGMTGNADLDQQGQITFQVSRAWACEDNATYNSSGYVPSNLQAALSASPTTGAAMVMGAKATNEQFYASGALFAGLATYLNSSGKGDFVTVNLGWSGGRNGGKSWLFVDGKMVDSATRAAATLAGGFANFYIGSDRGVANTFIGAGYYMRNLQVSTRAPMFAVHPQLSGIAMLSDSLLNSDDPINGNYKDVVSSWSMRQRLAEHGLYAGNVEVSVNGGYRLDDSNPGSYLKDQLAALLANKPTVVVIRGGTNDVVAQRCTQSTWQDAVTDYITDCFATSHVKLIVLVNIPTPRYNSTYDNATYAAQRAAGNAKIQAAADAWRDANPSDTRQVVVVDAYSRLGEESAADGTFVGQVNGSTNDLHLSGYGHYLHGTAIADGILSALK